jgi:hypothetical protein
MAPFEALYGRKCRSPVYWDDIGERKLLGPELITRTVEAVNQIRRHMRATQDRQRRWADVHRRHLEFAVGDHVFLRIFPTRGVIRFGSRGKLSPRYIGPFDIIERIRKVAYRLALPPSLASVHDVFHVSQLRSYVRDPSHIIDHSELAVRTNLSFKAQPVSIVDRREKVLKNKVIKLVRVSWNPQSPGESTWELEEKMCEQYPYLFPAGNLLSLLICLSNIIKYSIYFWTFIPFYFRGRKFL